MVELGWTRPELAAADPQDIEGIRWALYARALEPFVGRDIEGTIRSVDRIDNPPSATTLRSERRRTIEDLRAAQRQQRQVREILGLDDEDDDA